MGSGLGNGGGMGIKLALPVYFLKYLDHRSFFHLAEFKDLRDK